MGEPWPEPDPAAVPIRRRSAKSTAHFAYLITPGWDLVKIGHSGAPEGRLSELQVGSADPLRIAHKWRCDREAAKHLERQLHHAFAWARKRGEWFSIGYHPVMAAGDLYIAGEVERGARLAELFRLMAENVEEQATLKRAWYSGRTPKDRRAAEIAAKERRPHVERAHAGLMVEALELGMPPLPDDRYWEKRGGALERYRAIASG